MSVVTYIFIRYFRNETKKETLPSKQTGMLQFFQTIPCDIGLSENGFSEKSFEKALADINKKLDKLLMKDSQKTNDNSANNAVEKRHIPGISSASNLTDFMDAVSCIIVERFGEDYLVVCSTCRTYLNSCEVSSAQLTVPVGSALKYGLKVTNEDFEL